MKKLNFGCGSIQPEGWVNFDIDPEFKATEHEFKQEEFDIIVAHAVVQQFEWHDLVGELRFLRKLLKPGGVLRISLPDIHSAYRALAEDDRSWFPNTDEKTTEEAFCAWITWYSTSKTLLTPAVLGMKLKEAGFSSYQETSALEYVYDHPESTDLDTREGEFFFMEAIK